MTVSLDSLDDDVFRRMNDMDFPVARVLDGIDAAEAAGLAPIKINMVVRRGINEASVLPMARFFAQRGHILRFIEYMDVGHSNGWRLDDVVPADGSWPRSARRCRWSRWRRTTRARWPTAGATATAAGRSGVIASVTQPFCRDCTRARLSAEGKLYTCLFAVVATTCALRCAPASGRRGRWPLDRGHLGRRGPIATPSSARRRRRRCPRWRCSHIGG